ncbi:MAG: TonB-dependent receptor, partial [Flavobacteriaceae bacterium]|nr:TonB-dependent receptor [Flavobacteriaceae bacterium]
IEAEITGDAFAFNPVVGNANNDVLSNSKYGDTHRVIGLASKTFNFFGENAPTTVTTFFEYAKGGRFNYTYGGDLNGDGSNLNDLLYVPTEAEIGSMQFSGAGQAQAFNAYIAQDDYLSERRGQYTERYGALAPWRGRWDVKILQDIKIAGNNTLQLSLDILNFGNLISSEWGLVEQPRNLQPVGVNVDPNTLTPTYTFDPALTETFTVNANLLSRWQAQFGIRYSF